jgi:hypothetical protein
METYLGRVTRSVVRVKHEWFLEIIMTGVQWRGVCDVDRTACFGRKNNKIE